MSVTLAATTIADYVRESWGLAPMLASVLAALVHVGLLLAFFGVVPLVFIWAER